MTRWYLPGKIGLIPWRFVSLPEGFRKGESNLELSTEIGFMVFHICAKVDQLPMLGMVVFPPLMTESLFHGYINPYGIELMSLSPIIWK